MGLECVEVASASSWNDDAICLRLVLHAPPDHVRSHEPGHVDADVAHLVGKLARLHSLEYAMQALLGQPASQEEDVLRHAIRSLTAACDASTVPTTVTRSEPFKRST